MNNIKADEISMKGANLKMSTCINSSLQKSDLSNAGVFYDLLPCVCMYVLVYAGVCGCMFVCVLVYVSVCGCIWVYVSVCECMWVYVSVCGCMWVYVGVCECM